MVIIYVEISGIAEEGKPWFKKKGWWAWGEGMQFSNGAFKVLIISIT